MRTWMLLVYFGLVVYYLLVAWIRIPYMAFRRDGLDEKVAYCVFGSPDPLCKDFLFVVGYAVRCHLVQPLLLEITVGPS